MDRKRHLRMEDQGNAGLPAALAPQTVSWSESPGGGQVPMRRRQFITLLGGTAAAWPLVARAQQAGKLPTIGFEAAPSSSPWTAAFVQRLRELGWIEGRTIAMEYRWSEGNPARRAEIAAEFVRLKVNVHSLDFNRRQHVQAGDRSHPHRFCIGRRPPPGRRDRELGATRRQRHWAVDPVDRYRQQTARTLARGCARHSPIGGHCQCWKSSSRVGSG